MVLVGGGAPEVGGTSSGVMCMREDHGVEVTLYAVCHRVAGQPSSGPATMATSRWSRLSWLLELTRRPRTM